MRGAMSVTELFKSDDSTDDTELQFDAAGRLKHLLTLRGLDRSLITELLDQSEKYLTPMGQPVVRATTLQGKTVANLFFEPSTRTRASFDLAARRLGADVLNLDVKTSSRKKGESILDTLYTLQAMQVDIFVIRDASAGVPAYIVRHVGPHASNNRPRYVRQTDRWGLFATWTDHDAAFLSSAVSGLTTPSTAARSSASL